MMFRKSRDLMIAAMTCVTGFATVGVWADNPTVILNEYNAVRPGTVPKNGADAYDFGVDTSDTGNGGDWFELVVVGDGTAGSTVDMRGWKIDITVAGAAAGSLTLSNDAYWSNVQAGTILTFTEGDGGSTNAANLTLPFSGTSTQINAVNNFATLGYAWSNIFIGDSQYISTTGSPLTNGYADIMGLSTEASGSGHETNDNLTLTISNASLATILGPVGEGASGYGSGGIGGDEVCSLTVNPSATVANNNYTDDNVSTFGAPNPTGGSTVQDFSVFRTGTIGIIWDGTASGLQEGGSGTWSTGGSHFWNPATNAAVGFNNGDDVTFGAGGSGSATVNLGSDLTVGDIAFQNGTTYTLAGHKLTIDGDVRTFADATIASNVEFHDAGGNDTEVFTDSGKTLTLSGTLAGSDGFDITGLGTVKLTGNNAGYQGSVDVKDTATLRVEGAFQTSPGSGNIQVRNAGTLYLASTGSVGEVFIDATTGSGQLVTGEAGGAINGPLTMRDGDAKISGNITVNGDAVIAHSTISPGFSNSAGQLHFNNLNLGADANYTWQLFANTTGGAGTNYDQITVAGILGQDATESLTSGHEVNLGIEFHNALDLTDSFWSSPQQWIIADVAGSDSLLPGQFKIDAVKVVDANNDSTSIGWWPSFTVNKVGNDIVLNWNPDGAKEVQWSVAGVGPYDSDGTWTNGGSRWFDGVDLFFGHAWSSSALDSAIFGSDSADEGVGPTVHVTVDDANGPVAVQHITFENKNPHYQIDGDQLTIHGDVRAKISATFANDVVLAGDKTFTIGTEANGDDAVVLFTGNVTGSANIVSDKSGIIRFSGDASGFSGGIDLQDKAKLVVDHDLGSTAGPVNVTMQSGLVSDGELTGMGTIHGNVTLTDGDAKLGGSLTVTGMTTVVKATMSPSRDTNADMLPDGNTAGELHFNGGLTLGESADYTWQLFANTTSGAGTNFDHIAVQGAVTADTSLVSGSEVNIDVELHDAADRTDSFWTANHTWAILSATGGFDAPLTSSLFTLRDLTDVNGDDLFTVDPTFADRFSLAISGNDLNLLYTAVVAPTYLLGDFNLSGTLTNGDIQAMLNALTNLTAYKSAHNLSDADLLAIGDINHSGSVTNGDIQALLDLLTGHASASSAGDVQVIPEPATIGLLALGGLALLSCPRPRNPRKFKKSLSRMA